MGNGEAPPDAADNPMLALRREAETTRWRWEHKMTERVDLAKAVCDLRSAILGMQIAHGQNPMAASILNRHAATIETASKIALGFDETTRPEVEPKKAAQFTAMAWGDRIADEQLDELLARAEKFQTVLLRIDQFRDLVRQAKSAQSPRGE